MRFAILDYGVGNLFSLRTALAREGVEVSVTKGLRRTSEFDALVLPGVGGFGETSKKLPRKEILDLVRQGKTLIGICLGLQLFLDGSEEAPGKGLGLFRGRAMRLPSRVKVPQIGWNTLKIERQSEITDGVSDGDWVYYVHSYYPATKGRWVTATTDYGVKYPSIISDGNVVGTQFHPEKSGLTGRVILRNLLRTVRR